jgi:superoxide dismutase, Fe-Mn family
MKHELPPLPYALDGLAPVISGEAMEFHHGKHHKTYVDKLNEALSKTPQYADWTVEKLLTDLEAIDPSIRTPIRNHGGGHHNHSLFWRTMCPGGSELKGPLREHIDKAFGDFETFKTQFEKEGTGFFGSGWTFLVWDPAHQALEILSLPNQDSPLSRGKVPLMLCDLWEHAYYLVFRNRRPDWIKAWWGVVDWSAVSANLAAARS